MLPLSGGDDGLVKVAPLLAMAGDGSALLDSPLREEELKHLRDHGRTGRPLGDPTFLERLEKTVGRPRKPRKRGPKPKARGDQVLCPLPKTPFFPFAFFPFDATIRGSRRG